MARLDTGQLGESDSVQLFASLSGIASHHPVASTARLNLESTYYIILLYIVYYCSLSKHQ